MNLNRRDIALGVAASAVALAMTGAAFAQQSVELNVLYSNAYLFKDPMEQISRRFEEQNPSVTIKLSTVKDYTAMLELSLRSAITGDMPDVAFQGLSFIRAFRDRGLAVPLDDMIKGEPNWNAAGLPASVMTLATSGSATYGLPFAISVPTVYYNLEAIEAAGGDRNNLPKTWDEIVALASKVKARSGGIYFDYTPTSNWTFTALVESQGGHMMSADDKTLTFVGPEGLKALQTLHDIGGAGFQDMTRDQAKQAFGAGTLGILITSSSDTTLYEQQAGGRFAVGVSPFPVPSDKGTLPAGGNAAMIHTKDPAKQKAAWDYIKFVTNPESQTELVLKTAYMPVNDIAVNDPKLLGDFYKSKPNLMVPVRQLSIVGPWFSFPGENSLKATKVIENTLRSVLMRQTTPEDGLKEMAGSISRLLGL